MTRTEKLAQKIQKLYAQHKTKIDNLPTSGPKGGNNAATILGWTHLGNGTITKACNIANVPTMPFWSGSCTTPARSIPTCIADKCIKLYHQIFVK